MPSTSGGTPLPVPGRSQTSAQLDVSLGDPGVTNVLDAGAVADGIADDTAAIQAAIDATPTGGVVFFPPGRYRVSDEILVNRPVNVIGSGRGTQIFQSDLEASLLVFRGAHAISIRDLYLGSAATAQGASLIRLTNTHHVRVDNVILRGAYYGVHLHGSLLNTFVNLKSAVNIGGFFAPTSPNQVWVFAERFNDFSANANTFIAPALEGGVDGMHIKDLGGEGSVFLFGGTIEGVAGTGLILERTGLPTLISGTHMEGNGVADIHIDTGKWVRIQSVFANNRIVIEGIALNKTIADSLLHDVFIGPQAVRTRLENITINVAGTGGNVHSDAADTMFIGVSGVNPSDWFGTLGIGTRNPNSNPVGLTPHLKLQVDGRIRAHAFDTGDIIFRKDGEALWRMFEDEAGLHLEEVRTGEVSRVFLERDVAPLAAQLEDHGRRLQALEQETSPVQGHPAAGR